MDDDEDNDLFLDERIELNERIDLINQNDPSVTKFVLDYYEGQRMTEDQIRALFRGMLQNTCVRKLGLFWTPPELRGTICRQLLPPLLRENSSIEYLGFPRGMTNAEFETTEEVLRNNNTTVKTLDMDECDVRGHEGGEIVARLIPNNHNITTINLDGNTNLGSAGATRIAAALGEDDCALKNLNLSGCGIGDEGADALCTALQVNHLLETFRFDCNQITDEGYQAVARSLPGMSGLKEIWFGCDERQVSAAVLQQMMDGLRKNQSLQRIVAWPNPNSQPRELSTCCAFVGARNKMNSHLDEVRDASRDGRVAPVPIPIGPLLRWCCRQGNSEVQASLIYSEVQASLIYS